MKDLPIKNEEAANLWYSMTPTQRYEVMQKVEKKSGGVWYFRRCIDYVSNNMLNA